uniref:NADH dehydrogenase subunit 6 n=1 Tax=Ixodes ornithorhynchi TaxID=85878 RepID=UPI00286CE11D|nr:NADH dehydrogenase subunit 6 [Ixodes ornithorhynchi]WKW95248.1 NADH dehydrogenase subunit 6 [Ixodes ornithorhynchi]WKW95261.1 NADH dehydrogenase subunit 6 [Ixodes ornithorhynchi]
MFFLNFFIMSFFLFNHPMIMLLSLIATTIFISALIMKYTKFMWISLILILLILGGMLILFLYMISLIPNKKMILKKKNIFLLGMSLMLNFFMSMNFSMHSTNMYSLFSFPTMSWLIMVIMYLLLTLMVVMMIIISSKAPMKLYT